MGTRLLSTKGETELDAPANSSRHESHSTHPGSEAAMVFKNDGPVKIREARGVNEQGGRAMNFNNKGPVDIAKDIIALALPTNKPNVTVADFNNKGDVKVGGDIKVFAETSDKDQGVTGLRVRERVKSFDATDGDQIVVVIAEDAEKAMKKLQRLSVS